MSARIGAPYGSAIDEEGGTNWAAAAAVAAAPSHEEDWVNTGVDDDDDEEEEEELVIRHEGLKSDHRPTWILNVALPESSFGSESIFIDSGMTAERLGRCIIQAVSSNSEHESRFAGNYNSSLVGLFGQDDRVFYSLECILAMDPVDGAKRTFCVTKPVRRRNIEATNEASGFDLSSIFSYISTTNLLAASFILFLAIFIVPFGDLNQSVYSLLLLVPQDLPSLWRLISFALDWPAREVYRYGPSIVGWEGRDLIDICTQMNRRYYSIGLGRDGHSYEDRAYWRQHPEACETLYRMKEESFARMCRPFWYIIVLVVSFIAIQRLINTIFQKPPGPRLNPVDRAVLDTYRALQMLAQEHRRQDDLRHRQMAERR